MKKNKRKWELPSPSQAILTIITGIILFGTAWLLEGFHATLNPPERGQIAFFANQVDDNLEQTVITSIQNAKKSVLLLIYSLTDKAVLDALKQKSLEGVKVKVICDAKASPYVTQRLGPSVDLLRRFSPGIMHQKILVIDEKEVLIGSANMTGESLQMHANLIVALQCPELAAMILSKATTMTEYDVCPAIPQQEFTVAGQRLEMWFLPDHPGAVTRIRQLIRSAEKTVRVAMFTWTRYDLAKAVIEAKNRGVDVQVVIDRYAGSGSSAVIVSILQKAGVDIGLSVGAPLFHHKFLYIDRKVLVNGSANWTKAAFTKNDDCFIILHDLTESQIERMDKLWDAIYKDSSKEYSISEIIEEE